jgi:hypothetical protein
MSEMSKKDDIDDEKSSKGVKTSSVWLKHYDCKNDRYCIPDDQPKSRIPYHSNEMMEAKHYIPNLPEDYQLLIALSMVCEPDRFLRILGNTNVFNHSIAQCCILYGRDDLSLENKMKMVRGSISESSKVVITDLRRNHRSSSESMPSLWSWIPYILPNPPVSQEPEHDTPTGQKELLENRERKYKWNIIVKWLLEYDQRGPFRIDYLSPSPQGTVMFREIIAPWYHVYGARILDLLDHYNEFIDMDNPQGILMQTHWKWRRSDSLENVISYRRMTPEFIHVLFRLGYITSYNTRPDIDKVVELFWNAASPPSDCKCHYSHEPYTTNVSLEFKLLDTYLSRYQGKRLYGTASWLDESMHRMLFWTSIIKHDTRDVVDKRLKSWLKDNVDYQYHDQTSTTSTSTAPIKLFMSTYTFSELVLVILNEARVLLECCYKYYKLSSEEFKKFLPYLYSSYDKFGDMVNQRLMNSSSLSASSSSSSSSEFSKPSNNNTLSSSDVHRGYLNYSTDEALIKDLMPFVVLYFLAEKEQQQQQAQRMDMSESKLEQPEVKVVVGESKAPAKHSAHGVGESKRTVNNDDPIDRYISSLDMCDDTNDDKEPMSDWLWHKIKNAQGLMVNGKVDKPDQVVKFPSLSSHMLAEPATVSGTILTFLNNPNNMHGLYTSIIQYKKDVEVFNARMNILRKVASSKYIIICSAKEYQTHSTECVRLQKVRDSLLNCDSNRVNGIDHSIDNLPWVSDN